MKNKSIAMNVITVLTIALVVGMLIPFLYVSKFAYPWADDFGYGAETRTVFQTTGSLVQTFIATVKHDVFSWYDWQGTYTSCFLMMVQPAVWNVKAYHLTGAIMTGALLLSYLVLGNVLLKKVLGTSRQVAMCVMLIVFLTSSEMVVGIAEAFTWYNSAVHYTFMHAVYVFFVARVISFLCDVIRGNGRSGVVWTFVRVMLLCLLALLVAGGNNVTTLAGMMTVLLTEGALLFYYHAYTKRREGRILTAAKLLCPVTAFYLAGFMCNILAPGNKNRMELVVGDRKTDYVAVILQALRVSFADIKDKMTPELLMALVIVAVLIWYSYTKERALEGMAFSFPLPGVVLLGSFCFLSALYCPMLLVVDVSEEFRFVYTGATLMARTENVVFFFMILLAVGNIMYFLGWLYKKGLHAGSNVVSVGITAVAIVVCVIFCRNELTSFNRTYLTAAAVRDIRNQTAQYYGYQMAENTRRLMTEDKDVLVMPIAVDPKCLYPYDAADWKEGTRGYYHKDSVEYETEPYVFDR